MNRSEQITHERLHEVCARRSAKVYIKVRIADVLPIEGSGLPGELFEFALQGHYDFVVARLDDHPLFAIEVDGPSHDSTSQSYRDAKKDELSRRFGLPLRRISTTLIWDRSDGLNLISASIARWLDEFEPNAKGTAETVCPKCGSRMTPKKGKRGAFLSCSRFPKCRGSRDVVPMRVESRPADPETPPPQRSSPHPAPVGPKPQTVDWSAPVPTPANPQTRERPIPEVQQVKTKVVSPPIKTKDIPPPKNEALKPIARRYTQAIPDWLEAILWGLGLASILLFVVYLFFKSK